MCCFLVGVVVFAQIVPEADPDENRESMLFNIKKYCDRSKFAVVGVA